MHPRLRRANCSASTGSNTVAGSVAVGSGPTGIAADAGSVVGLDDGDSSVWRIDEVAGRVEDPRERFSDRDCRERGTAYVAIKAAKRVRQRLREQDRRAVRP